MMARKPHELGTALASLRGMAATELRDDAACTGEWVRIRGRLRGFETLWTPDRFSEVIRAEVLRGLERAWSADQIRARIRTTYDLDAESLPHASRAIEAVLGALRTGGAADVTDPAAFLSARDTAQPTSQRR